MPLFVLARSAPFLRWPRSLVILAMKMRTACRKTRILVQAFCWVLHGAAQNVAHVAINHHPTEAMTRSSAMRAMDASWVSQATHPCFQVLARSQMYQWGSLPAQLCWDSLSAQVWWGSLSAMVGLTVSYGGAHCQRSYGGAHCQLRLGSLSAQLWTSICCVHLCNKYA